MKQDEFNKIKELLAPFFAEMDVKKVVMFGSSSRNSATRKSDLDLMIVTETERRFFDRYEKFEKINEIIKGKTVDLLIYTPDELEKIAHRPFIAHILREGQTIYEC